MKLNATFAALKHPNYRLWFCGQMVSLFGAWMQFTAQGYLVYELTGSPAFLGYISIASGLPTCMLLLYGGVIADRVPRRVLLILAQAFMLVLAAVLAALTFLNWIQPWHIIVLSIGLGIANAFDAPARHAFVFDLVDTEHLGNAIALNSSLFNAALAVGPALAGVTYMLFGPAWCFAINGCSYIPVIIALMLIRLQAAPKPAAHPSIRSSVFGGMRYVVKTPIIRTLLCLVASLCLFGYSFTTLVPAWAVKILGGDAATNGLLQSARGCGAVLSALVVASLAGFRYKGRLLIAAAFIYPAVLVIFACIRLLPLALVVLVGVGVAMTMVLNLCNILLQRHVDAEVRGRVMSIYSLTLYGLMPIGGLAVGVSAEHIGEPLTVIITGVLALLSAAVVSIRAPGLRRLG